MYQLSFEDSGRVVNFGEDFRLYVTCRLPNPVFSHELSSRVTILNFSVTLQGLQDQVLNMVVKNEMPHKE